MGLLAVEENKALLWPPSAGPELWCILPLWRGETITILADGPSLTQEQVDMVRGRTRVIAINSSYKLAPWADILYACDANTWAANKGAPEFKGIKVGLAWNATKGILHNGWAGITYSDIRYLSDTGTNGLELAPNSVRTGGNSGYQSINMAVHLGVKRILLLGYDMKSKDEKHHWFNQPPDTKPPPYSMWLNAFETIAEPLKKIGVEVINCTPDSALKVFPMMKLEEAVL